jgi:hypothetical protein
VARVPGLVLSDEEFTRELQLLYNSNGACVLAIYGLGF